MALTATLTTNKAEATAGDSVTFSLTVSNTGAGTATITAVDRSTSPVSSSVAVGSISPLLPAQIASSGSKVFTWSAVFHSPRNENEDEQDVTITAAATGTESGARVTGAATGPTIAVGAPRATAPFKGRVNFQSILHSHFVPTLF